MPNRRRTWPYQGAADSPPALTQTPDALLNSGRSLAGPLRLGTAPGAGPRGAPPVGDTDLGMDRISPRPMDSIGQQYPRGAPPESTLVSRDRTRNGRR